MSDDGNIFYSQVDLNLQAELNARGRAGRMDRTERSMNYMLEKVANVELIAMKTQLHADSANTDDQSNILHRLGGTAVRSGEYLPTGNNGFLKDRHIKIIDPLNNMAATSINSSYRIAPFITSAEMQLNDHAMGYTNSVTVNIVIPNPDRDLDFMESVYARPGRAISLIFEHPDSAVITDTLLTMKTIQPNLKIKDKQLSKKMNRITFNGLVKSFTYSYSTDGTVDMTIYLLGVSNVFTNTTMYTFKSEADNLTKPAAGPQPEVKVTNLVAFPQPNVITSIPGAAQTPTLSETPITFYRLVYDKINTLYRAAIATNTNITDSYLIINKPYATIVSKDFESTDATWAVLYDWNKKEQRYITLALLIKFLNEFIISKQQSTAPNALIICSDRFCKSNYLPSLISSNPTSIWIPGGNHDKYGEKKVYTSKNSLYEDPLNFSNDTTSYPSRIFINLNVIDSITNELIKTPEKYNATEFLIKISDIISKSTGNFINMKLISYPANPDYLIYYDANYKGANSYNVKPYSVPMFANHPYGTIVHDFKFTSTLPQDMQSLMYTVNQSDIISEEKIAPFLNYMYNNRIITRSHDALGQLTERISAGVDPAIKAKLDIEYKKSHEKYLKALTDATIEFSKDGLTNSSRQAELATALIKHIQWPTPNIKDTSQMTAATYPFDVEFTIDGINGLRYGDTVEFDALPEKYKTNTTFSIIGITHTVSMVGLWTTNIKCVMRPKFD